MTSDQIRWLEATTQPECRPDDDAGLMLTGTGWDIVAALWKAYQKEREANERFRDAMRCLRALANLCLHPE